jgi:hypothetical protein
MLPFQSVNAWIFLNEDEPPGTSYSDKTSCYQTLITNDVYQSVDLLFIAFTEIVPTTTPGAISVVAGYTLQNGNVTHPGGQTNADYMRKVVADAKQNNPRIRFLTTLDWGQADQISKIFTGCTTPSQYEAAATAFAKNVMAFFQAFGLEGFDIDWEDPLSSGTTQPQFDALLKALRGQFGDKYLLTLSPASTNLLTGKVVNATVDFLNLQLYASWVKEADYLALGIEKSKLAFGATFEEGSRQETPQQVYAAASKGNYTIVTQWRLNSSNFQQEQDGQVQLYALCKP